MQEDRSEGGKKKKKKKKKQTEGEKESDQIRLSCGSSPISEGGGGVLAAAVDWLGGFINQ